MFRVADCEYSCNGALTRRRGFTLLEVVVALAILALGLTSALTIVGSARDRILRGQQRWAREHVTSQATEFFLLAGAAAALPPGILPQGFSANCQLEVVDDLGEFAREPIQGWVLQRLTINVYDLDGRVVGSRIVQTMGREDD